MIQPHPPRLRRLLPIFSFTRLVLNTGFRMVYPFLPTFARALQVSAESIALAVTARSTIGIAAPLTITLTGRRGWKYAMLLGMVIFSGGFLAIALWPGYGIFFGALLLAGAGKMLFDPAMQAYIGSHVPLARRNMAIGITEFGWSGSFLLGVPLAGWLIAGYGWRAPFLALSAAGLVVTFILWRTLPSDSTSADLQNSQRSGFRHLLNRPAAIAGLVVSLLFSLGAEVLFIVYGRWLEDQFALSVVALGAASIIIGLAEFSGEGLVATISDRIGGRRAVALGLLLNILAAALLPLLDGSLAGAMTGMFLVFISFEYAIVSAIALMTELAPDARRTLMAANLASISVGRAVGALLGTAVFAFGLAANAAITVACSLLSLWVLLAYVRLETDSQAGSD